MYTYLWMDNAAVMVISKFCSFQCIYSEEQVSLDFRSRTSGELKQNITLNKTKIQLKFEFKSHSIVAG